jgi:hypothetical protein
MLGECGMYSTIWICPFGKTLYIGAIDLIHFSEVGDKFTNLYAFFSICGQNTLISGRFLRLSLLERFEP